MGGALRTGLPITEDFSVGLNYSLYRRDITIPQVYENCSIAPVLPFPDCFNDGEASVALKQARGKTLTSLVGYSLLYNTLNNNLNPTSGIRAEFRQDFAGLGGDSTFIRTTGDLRYYYELPSDFVAMARGQAGYMFNPGGGNLRMLDQFFKGPELVRGFESSGIGPRDISTNRDDPLGGTIYWGVSAELQFPLFGIPREVGLKGAIFADAGSLFGYKGGKTFDLNGDGIIQPGESVTVVDDRRIRSSIGASLIWDSPVGPLRFDYAYALTKGRGDRTQAFRFSGGTRF